METFYILLVLGVITALTIAILAYVSKASIWIKLLVLPLFLSFMLLGYNIYIDALGSPIPKRPEGIQHYVQHIITPDMNLVVWVWDKTRGHRLYKYPYNREDAAKFQESADGDDSSNGKIDFGESGSGFIDIQPSDRSESVRTIVKPN